MFKYRGILPDEIGRQAPCVLLDMLDGLNEDNEEYTGDDPYLKMFYGM